VSLRLRAAEIWIPAGLKKRGVRDLCEGAARAFDSPPPDLAGLSDGEARLALARLTRDGALRVDPDPAVRDEAMRRLRSGGAALGGELKSYLGVRTRADVMRAARLLYRMIGIDFNGTSGGEIRIAACAFASAYPPGVCRIIAALDEGVLAGLAGGGRLAFSVRITDGAPACAARFEFPEALR
jgi:hypothetical protein